MKKSKILISILIIISSLLFVCGLPACSEESDKKISGSTGLQYVLTDDGNSYKLDGIGTCTETEITIASLYNGKWVTEIDFYALECTSITSVIIPDSIKIINFRAFDGCKSLKSITIPGSVSKICSQAFSNCTSLTSVNIEYGVTVIEDFAFFNCTSLANINIPDSVISIGPGVFSNCDVLRYSEYDSAKYLGNSNNPYLALIDVKDKSISSCTINNKTQVIAGHAFIYCTSLTNITIPDNIISIGDNAFCSLGGGNSCISLTSITFGKNSRLTSIGYSAFRDCTNLLGIELPNRLTEISGSMFWNCTSLTNITIPESVTEIGMDVFYNCTSLINVTYGGTMETWKLITETTKRISPNWNYNTGNYTVTCADGKLDKSDNVVS